MFHPAKAAYSQHKQSTYS